MSKDIDSFLYYFVILFHFLVTFLVVFLIPLSAFGIITKEFSSFDVFVLSYFVLHAASLILFKPGCSVTLLQNKLAEKIGKPKIDGFIINYFTNPLKIKHTKKLEVKIRIAHIIYVLIIIIAYLIKIF